MLFLFSKFSILVCCASEIIGRYMADCMGEIWIQMVEMRNIFFNRARYKL